jgi:GYF domain 2
MQVKWFYQKQGMVVGPVPTAELRFLLDAREIEASTFVRRGEDGPWLAAHTVDELVQPTCSDAKMIDHTDHLASDWHLSREAHQKMGPMSWDDLKAMATEGKLEPNDLIWRPGMAQWAQASRLVRPLDDSCSTLVRGESEGLNRFRKSSRLMWACAFIAILIGTLSMIAVWYGARTKSKGSLSDLATRSQSKRDTTKDVPRAPNPVLEEVLSDLRAGSTDRATRLLDQYLADSPGEDTDAAKLLRREIDVATSTDMATELAKRMSDEQLKSLLQQGLESLVASLETRELRSIYERTLRRALRQEKNRRQFHLETAIAVGPERRPVDPPPIDKNPEADRAGIVEQPKPPEGTKGSLLGRAIPPDRAPENGQRPAGDVLAERRAKAATIDLDGVLAKPEAFVGRTVTVKGLLKIGTRLSEVRGQDHQVLGWSVPVARADDSTVCTGEKSAEKYGVFVVLEDRLAPFMDRVFKQLGMKPTVKPIYRCILTVTTRRILVNGALTPVVVISSLEILGECDFFKVAQHEYDQAFRTLTIAPEEAHIDFGDGADWVERMGGEERFVQWIRRKLREIRRRVATNRDRDVVDGILARELAKEVNTALAINQIRALEGMLRRKILP